MFSCTGFVLADIVESKRCIFDQKQNLCISLGLFSFHFILFVVVVFFLFGFISLVASEAINGFSVCVLLIKYNIYKLAVNTAILM